ncbi:ADAMTS-like protein 1 [Corticium candelabrum]|uniref:ADAMTS-like protein 1 n=1 Tax=Corticium candelabrum TaxID=121492 RepID=UPI002E2EE447|nr:ADAMTS-like protein 1 [Corticium candelabrum]
MWKSSQVCLIGVVIGCLLVSVASQSGVLSGDDVLLLPTETTSDPFDQIQLSERYDWRTGRYSPCSVTCIGTQTRDVYCVETLRNGSEIRVDENLCDSYSVVVKPNSERTCGRECIEHAWNTTSWSNCSAVCGNGTQTRGVRCRRVTSGRNVADSECIRRGVGGKPPESRVCTRVCFYSTGRWRPCSVTCGGGKRTRGVRCIRKGTDRSMSIVRLSHCSADETLTMPKTSEDCNRNVCGEHK